MMSVPRGMSCLLQAHLQNIDKLLLHEALSLSTTLHNKDVFSWVSFFKGI